MGKIREYLAIQVGLFKEILSYTATPNFLGALRPKCYRNGSEKYKVKVNLEKNVEDAKKS